MRTTGRAMKKSNFKVEEHPVRLWVSFIHLFKSSCFLTNKAVRGSEAWDPNLMDRSVSHKRYTPSED